MNVLVIRLVTVLLIDSSFTSLRILSLYAFSFTVSSVRILRKIEKDV